MRGPAAQGADRRRRAGGQRRRSLTTSLSAASVLRRGLLIWGLGHLAIGDRRGLVLLVLQPLAIAGVLLVAIQLVDGTRWLIVFPPLAALLAVWLAQAVHAHQRAIQLGAASGGEIQAALFLPAAVAVLTVFWLIGGRHGSPGATLEAYVVAWMSGRPDTAAALYVAPPNDAELAVKWTAQSEYLTTRVGQLAAVYGVASGLDPEHPFDNLRFREPVAGAPGRQVVGVDIVRRQRVETMILGIIPTASQETVVVEQAGTITLELREQPPPDWLPAGRLSSDVWSIESVAIGGP